MHRTIARTAIVVCLTSTTGAALAQQGAPAAGYPERPVRVIVPVPPGGGHDVVGRIITNALSEALGKPFVVDNRAGAGSTIGTDIAAKARHRGSSR